MVAKIQPRKALGDRQFLTARVPLNPGARIASTTRVPHCVMFAALASVSSLAVVRWLVGRPPPSSCERLSLRDWLRLYRTLGLPVDASREQVLKAVSRLRKKYADDEDALERIESANLWILSRIISQEERLQDQRRRAAKLQKLSEAPKRFLMEYVLVFCPPSVRSMVEVPTWAHFARTSGLLGVFSLAGLCVPSQGTNFVGLGAAAALGLVYMRNRPEPVQDDMGHIGEVQKMNPKEMIAAVALVGACVLGGAALTALSLRCFLAPFQSVFCVATCFLLWCAALFFKVYGCFDGGGNR